MRKLLNVPFTEDLYELALRQVSDPCKIVFPTRVAADLARQRWQPDWQFEDCEFIAIEDLKDLLLDPGTPCATDDKRLLCLYQALTKEDREHFHIGSYFDSVGWGQNWFQFFEELCDEAVDADLLRDCAGNFNVNLLAWQEEYLQRILDVRQQYRESLLVPGLTDQIFAWQPDGITITGTGYRYVFVNQYYWSRLEKAMLSALEEAGNEIVLIEQFSPGRASERNLEARDLDLAVLTEDAIRTREVELVECSNPGQMVLAFLAEHAPAVEPLQASAVLVDRRFSTSWYRHWFDPGQFSLPHRRDFVQSGVYWFLHTLQTQLAALNESRGETLLPLRLVAAAASNPAFLAYYHTDWDEAGRTAVMDELRHLFDQDILYADSRLRVLDSWEGKREFRWLPSLLQPHFELLEELASVATPAQLVALVDAPGGLAIRAMCSMEELQGSDVLERFYERLSNFASLERLAVVEDWATFFSCDKNALAANLLRLLLEDLASAPVRELRPAPGDKPRIEISNLLDLRNLNYDTVAILHGVEGEYPSNPEPAWLFNERQRQRLGLKSYPLLRQRERYYFFRQVFSARRVLIYSYRNQEQNIEPGSFVTELQSFLEGLPRFGPKLEPRRINPEISALYQARKRLCANWARETWPSPVACDCGLDRELPDEFFVLPPAPTRDFDPGHCLRASYQSLSQLDKNPFAWYIKQLRHLRRIELRPPETLNRKLFGALLHYWLACVLPSDPGRCYRLADLAACLEDTDFLSQKLQSVISSVNYRYKLPHNYNQEFLTEVIAACLVESVRRFHQEFLASTLRDEAWLVLPEPERRDWNDEDYKTLCSQSHSGTEYCLKIRGQADLRLESPTRCVIVDFKTGGHEDDQLLFYEWYYYLLNDSLDDRELRSIFWMILRHEIEGETNPNKREKWRTRMRELLANCLTQGYPQAPKVANRRELTGITRADLYRPNQGVEE